jgi:competence protein ComEA
MSSLRKNVDRLFGFKRREKRATIILALILLSVIIIRFSLLSHNADIVVITPLSKKNIETESINHTAEYPVMLYNFDPNTASRDTLLALGLSRQQVSTLINYRNAGARFSCANDLLKVYGFDTAMVLRLKNYVVIEKHGNNSSGVRSKIVLPLSDTGLVKYSNKCIIELNACTAVQLQGLPGIGTVLSERIIKYRDLLGGFFSTDQLGEIYGIDTTVLNTIMELVYVNPENIKMISIDTCSYNELARHPYIGKEAARSIIKYRKLFGPPASLGVLTEQKVIDNAKARKMAPYCKIAGKAQ